MASQQRARASSTHTQYQGHSRSQAGAQGKPAAEVPEHKVVARQVRDKALAGGPTQLDGRVDGQRGVSAVAVRVANPARQG